MSVLYLRDEDGKFVSVQTIKGNKGDKGDKGDKGEPGSPGKDAEVDVFYVNFGGSNYINTSDKTVDELFAAANAGMHIVGRWKRSTNVQYYYPYYVTSENATFYAVESMYESSGLYSAIVLYKSGDQTITSQRSVAQNYLTDDVKQSIVSDVIGSLQSETWTFTLLDGSTVTKEVVLAGWISEM